jgi:pyridoxine 5-phosphate synthase
MVKLGVNLDHVATIRQQRYTPYPDMLTAIKYLKKVVQIV